MDCTAAQNACKCNEVLENDWYVILVRCKRRIVEGETRESERGRERDRRERERERENE